jgi:FlhB HrpN YscU SpaS Family
LKIRSIAEDHAIPVVEDKPLARSLYAAVDVDRPIPTEFYRAVAEIEIHQRIGDDLLALKRTALSQTSFRRVQCLRWAD